MAQQQKQDSGSSSSVDLLEQSLTQMMGQSFGGKAQEDGGASLSQAQQLQESFGEKDQMVTPEKMNERMHMTGSQRATIAQMQAALQASPASNNQAESPQKDDNQISMPQFNAEATPDQIMQSSNDDNDQTAEPKNDQSASGLTQDMENLSINDNHEQEETKSTTSKKKRVRKPKETAQSASSKTDGPAANTRGRLAAFLAAKKQEGSLKKMRIGVVFDELMTLHRDHGGKHPERPERVMAIYLNLVKKGLFKQLVRIDSEEAQDQDLLLCHKALHIKHVREDAQELESKKNHHIKDTYMNKFTAQAALISAGSTIEAVSAVCSQTMVDNAFAIVRPPGHHAHCNIVAGFCFFNNAALAARVAQKKLGAKKVVIFDWDVHVGDGTSQIFYDDPSVLYISIHRFDLGKFYPGPAGAHTKIGEGAGKGFNVHFPFNVERNQKPMIGDKDYIYACEQVFFPMIKEFNPDLLIISAGFDSALGDKLGQIGVSPVGYAYMTWGLRNLCPKTTAILEGGYCLEALECSSEAVVQTLMVNPGDLEGFNKLLSELSGTEGLTLSQLVTEAQLDVRESFKQIASNLAKVHKKTWPMLSHLICEKVRSRRGSGISSSQNSSGDSQNCNEPARVFENGKPRTQSFNAENAMQHALSVEGSSTPSSRPRADSYVVDNPIPEEPKI